MRENQIKIQARVEELMQAHKVEMKEGDVEPDDEEDFFDFMRGAIMRGFAVSTLAPGEAIRDPIRTKSHTL